MPTATYTPLATVTLGTAAASVTFSSIPATYRDLILVMNGSPSTGSYAFLRFNGDTGSNYNYVFMYGDGSGTASSLFSNQTQGYIGNIDATVRTTFIAQVMDFSATDKHKTFLSRNGQADGLVIATAGRWANTSAVTSMSVNINSGTFAIGHTFSLYGVIA
jgi:hypothetical protein